MKRLVWMAGCLLGIGAFLVLVGIGTFAGPTVVNQISGQTRLESLQVGDLERTYRLYRPTNAAEHPGVMFVLQGASGGLKAAGLMEAITHLNYEADRLGWIVVYPDAAPVWSNGWDPWTCCGNNQDVVFFSNLIDKLEADYGVDASKVYVTGWSRGGMMTYRIGCELATKVAAIAPVDGNLSDQSGNVSGADCHPEQPVSVLAINGSADLNVPIDGGHSLLNPWETIEYAAPADVIDAWRELDGCGTKSHIDYTGPLITTSWNCSASTAVVWRVISGGDHAWPGTKLQFLVLADLIPPEPMGGILPDMSFDASQLIADFFERHPRPAAG